MVAAGKLGWYIKACGSGPPAGRWAHNPETRFNSWGRYRFYLSSGEVQLPGVRPQLGVLPSVLLQGPDACRGLAIGCSHWHAKREPKQGQLSTWRHASSLPSNDDEEEADEEPAPKAKLGRKPGRARGAE